MARYMEDISAGIPGAQTAYDSFIQETRNAERTTLSVCFFPVHVEYCVVNQ